MTVLRLSINPQESPSPTKIAGLFLPLIRQYEIIHPYTNWHPIPCCHSQRWPILCGMFFSIYKSISNLSLCLLLNSFHTETHRTRASASPDARWVFKLKGHGVKSQSRFRLGSSPSSWVQVSIRSVWFQFQLVSITDSRLWDKKSGAGLESEIRMMALSHAGVSPGEVTWLLVFHFPHLQNMSS